MSEKRPRAIWKWLFIFSMALNLMFIGLIGGTLWTRSVDGALQRAQGEFLAVLPEDKKPAFRQIFREHNRRSRPHRWQMYWRFRKAIKEMESQDFNEKRFEEFVAQIRQTHIALTKLRYQLIIDATRGLNYEERKAFVRIWRKRLRRLRKLDAKSR